MSGSFVTPLRYPGGKGRLGSWFSEIIDNNNMKDFTFVEPYAGGAGAALYLLVNKKVKNIILNDVDPVIYCIWWSILNDKDRLVSMIRGANLTMDEWRKQREIVKRGDTSDKTLLGFAGFYQNRTNRSGIINGGVIGGLKQEGNYKLDARFNKEKLIGRIEVISNFSDKITLSNHDAIGFIKSNKVEFKDNCLLYLDPPYFNKGWQLYRNFYDVDDHRKVSDILKEVDCPWVVTYDNCKEIKSLYGWAESHDFNLRYSVHDARPIGKEICVLNKIKYTPIYFKR